MRIAQEIVLGIGGVRALRALGIAPAAWHINEGHAAFLNLERCRELVATGLSFNRGARGGRRQLALHHAHSCTSRQRYL